ncbi:hypothetical protein HD553DRAFT_339229 [Filobasidium floriforme]|uniref:uncharacterized protein n=1 Tax=Filobasidium floriforme TaxID=5210 RepID=UPI001E8CDBEC|nr:uncharacterized protein HD553DRAFT_339229 [Filobasidium floriforme]KAH8089038.1 hypothetical protein HD553DRAFT_339229 [Filobasidium floriforme]
MSNAEAGPSNNTARVPKSSPIAKMAQARREKAAERAAKKEARARRLALNVGRVPAEDKGKEKEKEKDMEVEMEVVDEDGDEEENEEQPAQGPLPPHLEWRLGFEKPQPKRNWLGEVVVPQPNSDDSDVDVDEAFREPKKRSLKIKLNVPEGQPPPPAGTPPPSPPASPPGDVVKDPLGDVEQGVHDMGDMGDMGTLSPVPDQGDGDFEPDDDEDELGDVDELEEEPEPVPNDASWEIDCARLDAALEAAPDAAKRAVLVKNFEKYKASKLYWTFQRMWTYWCGVQKDSTHLSFVTRGAELERERERICLNV